MDIENKLFELFMRHEKKWVSEIVKENSLDNSNLTAKDIGDAVFEGHMLGGKLSSKIEHQFLICFPLKPFNKSWTFSEFAAYVDDRARKPAINLRLAQKLTNESKVNPLFALMVFAVTLLLGWVALIDSFFFLLPLLLPLLILVGVLNSWYSGYYYNALARTIKHGTSKHYNLNQTHLE